MIPFKDPEQRRKNSKRWRDEKIAEGYGKALYARRKQRYENEEKLRGAVEATLYLLTQWNGRDQATIRAARKVLRDVLKDATEIGKPIQYMPVQKGEEEVISTKDFQRLSAELTARELDFFTWAEEHGIDAETVDDLSHSFMFNLTEKLGWMVKEMVKERGEDEPKLGLVDPTPAMMAMFVQTFIFGWESAVQYGNNNDPSHVTGF